MCVWLQHHTCIFTLFCVFARFASLWHKTTITHLSAWSDPRFWEKAPDLTYTWWVGHERFSDMNPRKCLENWVRTFSTRFKKTQREIVLVWRVHNNKETKDEGWRWGRTRRRRDMTQRGFVYRISTPALDLIAKNCETPLFFQVEIFYMYGSGFSIWNICILPVLRLSCV